MTMGKTFDTAAVMDRKGSRRLPTEVEIEQRRKAELEENRRRFAPKPPPEGSPK
jgi:hypothetical protein